MICHPLPFCGHTLLADPDGALAWPAQGVLAVADLHIEKGSAYAGRGRMLPPYDTQTTLDRLDRVLARHRPRQVLCLGDSFHDPAAPHRLPAAAQERLAAMTAGCAWWWIAGNHDPTPPAGWTGWGGQTVETAAIGDLIFRHQACEAFDREAGAGGGEVSGHLHPVAVVRTAARRIRGRCFIGDHRRLVLPAFGAYAGGLNVLEPEIARLFGADARVFLLGRDRVHQIPRLALVPDRA